jgi:antitoxin component YwqK of YwqJK toxin-antitoxin module
MRARQDTVEKWPDGSPKRVVVYIEKDGVETLFEAMNLGEDGHPMSFEVPGDNYERRFTHYNDGSLESETEFKDGKIDGLSRFLYRDGSVASEQHFSNGLLDGSSCAYYPGNRKKYVETWNDSLLLTGTYFNTNGDSVSAIRNGNGMKVLFYDNGTKQSSAEYRDGKRNGRIEIWNDRGVKISEMVFRDGLLDGRARTWDDNGVKKSVADYRKGLKNGLFIFYGEDGRKKFVVHYENGRRHGVYRTYDKSGNVVYKAVFDNGIKVSEKWFGDGSP